MCVCVGVYHKNCEVIHSISLFLWFLCLESDVFRHETLHAPFLPTQIVPPPATTWSHLSYPTKKTHLLSLPYPCICGTPWDPPSDNNLTIFVLLQQPSHVRGTMNSTMYRYTTRYRENGRVIIIPLLLSRSPLTLLSVIIP